jgi:hypothetical protein
LDEESLTRIGFEPEDEARSPLWRKES